MKKRIFISLISIFTIVFLFNQKLSAQDQIADMMKAGVADANKLMDAYISPFGKAFGCDLNGGWFNTAETHKPLGFDLTISGQISMIPTTGKTYNFSDLGTSNVKLASGSSNTSPTIFGSKTDGPTVDLMGPNPFYGTNPGQSTSRQPDTTFASFKLPGGTGLSMMPLPVVQLRVGVYKNTDVMIRFVPTISIPGSDVTGKVGLWGVGLMHDIKQWIPKGKSLPFDLAIGGGFTKFKFKLDFPGQLLPEVGSIYSDGTTPTAATYDNQGFEYNVSALTINAIISKKISVITFYGALGYNYSKADLNLKGNYPVVTGIANPIYNPTLPVSDMGKLITTNFADPINITSKVNSVRGTLGFRLKLAAMTLHADYTLAKYPVIGCGIGVSVR